MVRARIERAVKHLTGRTPSDEDLHAARKELRKARATLQLGRKALGHRVFARANTALRDAARPLGAVRDSKVLLDRLDEFAGRFGRGALDELRSTLRRERLQARRASLGAAALRTQRGRLRALAARSTRWPVGRHGWSVLGPAMERTYARGRRALAAAREPLGRAPARMAQASEVSLLSATASGADRARADPAPRSRRAPAVRCLGTRSRPGAVAGEGRAYPRDGATRAPHAARRDR